MTVLTLKRLLSRYPDTARVTIGHPSGEEVLFVCKRQDRDTVVWLETASDIDLAEEYCTLRDKMRKEGKSDLEIWAELGRIRITEEMLRKVVKEDEIIGR